MALPTNTGYAEATLTNPSSSLTDFTLYVDLANMPQEWWDAADSSDPGKLRVADENDNEISRDVHKVDDTNQDGGLRAKYSGTLSNTGMQGLRIYPPQSGLSSYTETDTFGQHNAYDSDWAGYWPDGGGADRTSNGNDMSGVNGVTAGGASGVVGDATDYEESNNQYSEAGDIAQVDNNNTSLTVISWFNAESLTNQERPRIVSKYSANGKREWALYVEQAGADPDELRFAVLESSDNFVTDQAARGGDPGTGQWVHAAGRFSGSNETEVYRNGSLDGTAVQTVSNFDDTVEPVRIGATTNSQDDAGDFWDGLIDEAQIHSATRSADWIGQEYDQTSDQDSFWNLGGGTWTWQAADAGAGVPPPLLDMQMIGSG